MGWYKGNSKKVTMEKWDREDLYVVFRDIQSLNYGDMKKLQAEYADLDVDNPEEANVDRVLELLTDLIEEWHMLDPETDEPLDKPEGADGWTRLPMSVISEIIEGAGIDAETGVPKENETSPEQPPKD